MSDTEKAIRAGLLTFGPSPLLTYYRTHRNADFVAAQGRLLDEMEVRVRAMFESAKGVCE